jgi:uncharacterized protein (DUF305 family)
MAGAELKKGSDSKLKALAKNIIAAQQREISQMRKQLGGAAHTATMMHGAGAA